ncbi:MAG: prepilin peptidase [Sedimentisphaerales bacterium]|nr:prepilin peptidase [Sedimentisphaerales bacterium]MBN2841840.1 prepilin peptidase [Sedimentisphaerales bacterium]
MPIPPIVWLVFLFVLGACIGSFINVVVWRMPREMSLSKPGSHCPACKHPLAWYDNVPILAWFYLGGKCRYCKCPYSFKYPFFEFLTGVMYAGLFWLYFVKGIRADMPAFEQGGWSIYAAHIILLSCLLAGSLIDAVFFIIPLSISYFAAVCGLALAGFETRALALNNIIPDNFWQLAPSVGPETAALAIGGSIGLLGSMLLLKYGLIRRSFLELEQWEQAKYEAEKAGKPFHSPEPAVNARAEMIKEMAFLCLPVVLGLGVMKFMTAPEGELTLRWATMLHNHHWLMGILGSVYGYLIGAVTVWATRIFGSLLFNKEAMGLGDVHLMGAVGAVLGWHIPLIAFFLAPFVGLGWALVRLITRRQHEIPYGPFLSVATVIVMLYHDKLVQTLMSHFMGK